jgi:hypothetical protein
MNTMTNAQDIILESIRAAIATDSIRRVYGQTAQLKETAYKVGERMGHFVDHDTMEYRGSKEFDIRGYTPSGQLAWRLLVLMPD